MQKKTNILNGIPVYWKKSNIYLKGGNNRVTLGKDIYMHNTKIKLFGNASLELDDGVYMEGCTFMIKDSHVHIGRNSEMMKVKISAYNKSFIDLGTASTLTGEFDAKDNAQITAKRLWCTWPPLVAAKEGKIVMADCGLADTVIYNTDYHPIYDFSGKRLNYNKDVFIDDDVWVGRKTAVLKGVNIGKGSILGFGTIVSKDVPPHCIVAGQPARIVKENVVWAASEEKTAEDMFPINNYDEAAAFLQRSKNETDYQRHKFKRTCKAGNFLKAWWVVQRSK
ncbi:MAG: acyltransferase [Alphaproteobacteria bacterium]|nr:acyltransferase [Alphaproteobacteria bacterium]